MKFERLILIISAIICIALTSCKGSSHNPNQMLNVSYDPTREFYQEFNEAFAAHWKTETGHNANIKQSHGGAGKQARSVIDGLPADIVTLALSYDIDAISEKTGLLPNNWQSRLPNRSCPYTSTVVFLVRKGNPKQIHDWDDLVGDGVEVITPNPKTSGGARWNYLAAWGYFLQRELGDFYKLDNPFYKDEQQAAQQKAREYVTELYKHVPVLDTGARGSTTTFIQRGIGDVLLTWENEAYLAINEFDPDEYEIVIPSLSILAEPPVALIDKNADEHGTRELAQAYLEYLYSPIGQRIVAKHYYRPYRPEYADPVDNSRLRYVETFSVDQIFGGWHKAQETHFADGGVFDQIYLNKADKR